MEERTQAWCHGRQCTCRICCITATTGITSSNQHKTAPLTPTSSIENWMVIILCSYLAGNNVAVFFRVKFNASLCHCYIIASVSNIIYRHIDPLTVVCGVLEYMPRQVHSMENTTPGNLSLGRHDPSPFRGKGKPVGRACKRRNIVVKLPQSSDAATVTATTMGRAQKTAGIRISREINPCEADDDCCPFLYSSKLIIQAVLTSYVPEL